MNLNNLRNILLISNVFTLRWVYLYLFRVNRALACLLSLHIDTAFIVLFLCPVNSGNAVPIK